MYSMTGFAALTGQGRGSAEGRGWVWDVRSVNGRGLDLRLRLAEGCESLETPLRDAFGKALKRGNVTVSLKLGPTSASEAPALDGPALDAVLTRLAALEARARAQGLSVGPTSAGTLLGLKGVLDAPPNTLPPEALEQMAAQIPELVESFQATRAKEGSALGGLLEGHLSQLARLNGAARETAEARDARTKALLPQRVQALLATEAEIEPERLAQELALLAVKGDVSEEMDRLATHIDAARALVRGTGPAGRKLEFLTQEFNREANTLCAKAGSADLTAIGLDMKVAIDQMREQAANVE